jgi:hypothetical protein
MNFLTIKNQIFKTVKNPELINISYKQKFTEKNKLNLDKLYNFVIYKSLLYFKENYSYMPINDYSIEKSIFTDWVYIILKSNHALTHPFICFANINNNELYICLTFGKTLNLGQINLNEFEKLLMEKWKHLLTKYEYYALYLLFADSVAIRKKELITHNKYSLLNCNNIKQCITTTNKIKKNKNLNKTLKIKEIKEKEVYYANKAIKVLEKFFNLLENKEFEEAYNFLKIDKKRKGYNKGKLLIKTKYFNKQRLDTFFKSNKKIIGHLQIFIDLYQFIHLCVNRINN